MSYISSHIYTKVTECLSKRRRKKRKETYNRQKAKRSHCFFLYLRTWQSELTGSVSPVTGAYVEQKNMELMNNAERETGRMQSGKERGRAIQQISTDAINPTRREVQTAMDQMNVDRNTKDRG